MNHLHAIVAATVLLGACAGHEERITPLGKQRPPTIRTCLQYCEAFGCDSWGWQRARMYNCRIAGPGALWQSRGQARTGSRIRR